MILAAVIAAGVNGITPATSRIEAESCNIFGAAHDTIRISPIDNGDREGGRHMLLPRQGCWMQYNKVDFSRVNEDAYIIICVKADNNTTLCVRDKSATGKIISKIDVAVKSDGTAAQGSPFRRDVSGQWIRLTAPVHFKPMSVTDIVVTCEGSGASIDWMLFKNRPRYFRPVTKVAQPSLPDAQGFIRRWRLMEPISQDIPSNIVFSDTWLRRLFTNSQPQPQGRWHVMDSESYNMKLFRFGEKYGSQLYGNLFWCETIITCSEDITDVRLAAGSNGASMWWLDGKEVLFLEGDRRMVQDDGVSRRLTLHRGRNVLRCAVVNGPGLTDMCARFVDEKGKPITTYNITTK